MAELLIRASSQDGNHARKALKAALCPKLVKPRPPRPPKYGPKVIAALIFCWGGAGHASR